MFASGRVHSLDFEQEIGATDIAQQNDAGRFRRQARAQLRFQIGEHPFVAKIEFQQTVGPWTPGQSGRQRCGLVQHTLEIGEHFAQLRTKVVGMM